MQKRRCGLLLQIDWRGLCVRLSLFGTLMSPATDGDAVWGQTRLGPRNHVHVLDGCAHWRHVRQIRSICAAAMRPVATITAATRVKLLQTDRT